MGDHGRPHALWRRSLATRNAQLATTAALELGRLELCDALELALLYVECDDPRAGRALARWHGRLVRDAGLETGQAQLALAALAALATDARRAGALALRELCERHALAATVVALDAWLATWSR